MRRIALLGVLSFFSLAACAAPTSEEDTEGGGGENALTQKADEHWFYAGGLPKLESASITVSLKGHTARVSGTLPASTQLPHVPHVKTKRDGDKLQVEVVYPVATGKSATANSRPGTYNFYGAKPYRPDGIAWTQSAGNHHVPWGGFPFLGYNNGIAFHGPITFERTTTLPVWYLRRGTVSAGCNRMAGEHVVELAHLIGVNMRKVYRANREYDPAALGVTAKVNVIADYDQLDGKYVDVDYPTDVGATRPGKEHGDEKVVMFGSWVASETPDGKDLPSDQKWEGGVNGKLYVFAEHTIANTVCSFPASSLSKMQELAGLTGGELPKSLCEKQRCIKDALASGDAAEAKRACGL